MNIVKVQDDQSALDFLRVPTRIYRNDPNWIRPLDQDIETIFDPKQNEAFKGGIQKGIQPVVLPPLSMRKWHIQIHNLRAV
jgi:hypothetical protein